MLRGLGRLGRREGRATGLSLLPLDWRRFSLVSLLFSLLPNALLMLTHFMIVPKIVFPSREVGRRSEFASVAIDSISKVRADSRSLSSSVHSRFSIPSQRSRREHEEGSRYHELFDPQERQGESRLDLPLVLCPRLASKSSSLSFFPPFPPFFRSTLPPSDES